MFMRIFIMLGLFMFSCHKDKVLFQVYDNGQIRLECEEKNGAKHGECIEYYSDGAVSGILQYSKDTLHGNAKIFRRDGQLKAIVPWRNGKIDGLYQGYFPNGNVQEKANYKNGNLEGEASYYFSNGKLGGVLQVNKSQKKGTEFYFHENDSLSMIVEWIIVGDDNFANTHTKFNKNGDTIFQDHYSVIRPAEDTVLLGEYFVLQIELMAPKYQNMQVVLGSFDSYYNIVNKNSLDTIQGHDFTAKYSLKTTKSGPDTLRGVIEDYKVGTNPNGTEYPIVQPYYFERGFFVRSSSSIPSSVRSDVPSDDYYSD